MPLSPLPAITYLGTRQVVAVRQTEAPRHRTRTGYGVDLPSTWQVKLADKRWRRVYIVCYSNAGSAYIYIAGKPYYLGAWDPSDFVNPKGTDMDPNEALKLLREACKAASTAMKHGNFALARTALDEADEHAANLYRWVHVMRGFTPRGYARWVERHTAVKAVFIASDGYGEPAK